MMYIKIPLLIRSIPYMRINLIYKRNINSAFAFLYPFYSGLFQNREHGIQFFNNLRFMCRICIKFKAYWSKCTPVRFN